MCTLLAIVGWGLFVLAVIIGLTLDLVGLFGNWVILCAVGAAWALTGFERFGAGALVVLAVLAALGEVVEALAAGYGASRFGGSRGSIVAALAGCLGGAALGTAWFPVVGTLIGACVGAFLGATLSEYLLMEKEAHEAFWTGFGAALGKVAGMFAKTLVGLVMLGVAAATF